MVCIVGVVELLIVLVFIFYEIIESLEFVGYEWEDEIVLLKSVLSVFDIVDCKRLCS